MTWVFSKWIFYPFRANCRSFVKSPANQTRLKANLELLEESRLKLQHSWKEPNYSTECWFMALHSQHLAYLPAVRFQLAKTGQIGNYSKKIDELKSSVWRKGEKIQNRIRIAEWEKK